MIKTGVRTTVGMVVMGALLYVGASQAGGFQITEITPLALRQLRLLIEDFKFEFKITDE